MQTKAGGFGYEALNRQPTVVRMQLPQRTQLEVDQSKPSENQSSDGLLVSCVRLRRCRRLIVPTRAI